MKKMSEKKYIEECRRIISENKDEIHRISQYEYCELEYDFLGFLDSYRVDIPKDFTIIDLGCYQAVQSVYFKEHAKYIGIDAFVENEWRFRTENAEHYQCSIQQFIKEILPALHLDPEKTFAICSYVPDDQARAMVRETFPYYRDVYCTELKENLPELEKELDFE